MPKTAGERNQTVVQKIGEKQKHVANVPQSCEVFRQPRDCASHFVGHSRGLEKVRPRASFNACSLAILDSTHLQVISVPADTSRSALYLQVRANGRTM